MSTHYDQWQDVNGRWYDSMAPSGPALTRYVAPKESATPLFQLPPPSFRNVICAAALVVVFGLLLAAAGLAWIWL